MNKHDVIVKIAKDTGITKTSAAAAVDSLIDGIMKSLKKGDPVSFVGFGTFKISNRKARVARNPRFHAIDQAVGAQIHPGRLGEGGPSLVLLHVGENGDDGCVGADPRILSEIQNDPRGYYLEVDDQNGPAMRGQLDAPDYRNRY